MNETVIKIRRTLGGAATLSEQGRMCDSHLPGARARWSCSERIKNKTVNITYDASRRRQVIHESLTLSINNSASTSHVLRCRRKLSAEVKIFGWICFCSRRLRCTKSDCAKIGVNAPEGFSTDDLTGSPSPHWLIADTAAGSTC